MSLPVSILVVSTVLKPLKSAQSDMRAVAADHFRTDPWTAEILGRDISIH